MIACGGWVSVFHFVNSLNCFSSFWLIDTWQNRSFRLFLQPRSFRITSTSIFIPLLPFPHFCKWVAPQNSSWIKFELKLLFSAYLLQNYFILHSQMMGSSDFCTGIPLGCTREQIGMFEVFEVSYFRSLLSHCCETQQLLCWVRLA